MAYEYLCVKSIFTFLYTQLLSGTIGQILAWCFFYFHSVLYMVFPAILGKAPWPKFGKTIDLTSKLGEINDIEHNKGSKIYPQDHFLDCIMSSIQLKHKCLSIIMIWIIVSHK